MSNVVVNRLRLNNLYIGYCVQCTKGNGKVLGFDMGDSLLKPFLGLLGEQSHVKGSIRKSL